MEKTLRSLNGLPVVCAGKRVGRVAQAALSGDLRRMDGLWVDTGLGGARFVPAEAIEVLGDVSVTVDAPGKREKLKKNAPLPPRGHHRRHAPGRRGGGNRGYHDLPGHGSHRLHRLLG